VSYSNDITAGQGSQFTIQKEKAGPYAGPALGAVTVVTTSTTLEILL